VSRARNAFSRAAYALTQDAIAPGDGGFHIFVIRHRLAHSNQELDSMTERTIKVPGPDHPITVEPARARVVVTVAGQVIADTENALVLREASYPPVYYIPRNDVEMTQLQRTDHSTYCPYKGDCAYYSVPIGGERTVNAVWTYESPYAPVKEIARHLAFYPDRVDSIDVRAAG
jgi:uncharacterized protein (DUF427 family)